MAFLPGILIQWRGGVERQPQAGRPPPYSPQWWGGRAWPASPFSVAWREGGGSRPQAEEGRFLPPSAFPA